jgi:hypothetical protein
MSASNLAVRLEHTATDLLSHPPRPLLQGAANNARAARTGRPRISITNRKSLRREPGLRLFQIR